MPEQQSTLALKEITCEYLQSLQQLPIGACVIDKNDYFLLWNRPLQKLSGICEKEAIGKPLCALEQPWRELLRDFITLDKQHLYKQRLTLGAKKRWLNLHKSSICGQSLLLLIEDISETWLFENHLIHSERLASIGRLAAGVAHEIGNPITAIACLAQNLRAEREDDEEIKKICSQIVEQSKRVSHIVRSLLGFAHNRAHSLAKEPVKLAELTEEAITLLSLDKHSTEVHFHNLCNPFHVAIGDTQRLLQVLLNLLANARDASPIGAAIRIQSTEKKDTVELLVEDQGSGVPKHLAERLFEPFFTTKIPGQGTGLGLALAYAIVEEHHGQISLDSSTGNAQLGSRFRVRLPRYAAQPSESTEEDADVAHPDC